MDPKLSQAARAAHIVPGLAHTSLISINNLIDAGCKVTYDTEHVKSSTEETWCGKAQENH